MARAIVLLSGGMDSTALAYLLAEETTLELHALSFDYGQRHGERELERAERTAMRLGAFHDVVEMAPIADLLGRTPHGVGSALVDPEAEIPEGHYSAENMKATVVPNRNAIMLNIAIGVAVAREADFVAVAVHAGDHPIYPDCRPKFIRRLNALARTATEGFSVPHFEIRAPFVNIDKAAIARIGDTYGVPWEETWSCYAGGEVHCGRCGTCVERAEAFHLADVTDPTEYADPDFWRAAVHAA